MELFLFLFTVFIYSIQSRLDDVNHIIETLEKNSINDSLSNLKPNKILQKNLLIVDELPGNFSIKDKNLLLEKLFLRDQKVEKLIEKFTHPTSVVEKFSNHNSSKVYSNASTFLHKTFFNKDGSIERRENDSDFKAVTKDLKMKSVFKNLNSTNNLIAKYKIPPLLIRADLDKELNIQKQVLKTPRLLARIRSRTENLQIADKNKLEQLNNKIPKKKDKNYDMKSITKILDNNKIKAASELTDIMDKFKVQNGQKSNKSRQKQLFHSPPEIIREKSTKKFYNQINNTNNKNSTLNIKKMNVQNNEIINVSLQDKIDHFETLGNFVTDPKEGNSIDPNEKTLNGIEVENIQLPTSELSSNATSLIGNEINSLSSQANALLDNITSDVSAAISNISNIISNETTDYPSLNISDISNSLNNLTKSLLAGEATNSSSLSTSIPIISVTEKSTGNMSLISVPALGNITLPSGGTLEIPLNNENIVIESTTLMMVESNSNISITTIASILNENVTTTSIVTSIPNSISTIKPDVLATGVPTLVPPINSLTVIPETTNTTIFPMIGTTIDSINTTQTVFESTSLSPLVESSTISGSSSTINSNNPQTTAMPSLSTLESILSTTNMANSTVSSSPLTTIFSNISSTGMTTTILPNVSNTEMTTPMASTILPSVSSTGMETSMASTVLPNVSSTEMISSLPTTISPGVSSTGMETSMASTVLPNVSSTEMISSFPTTISPGVSNTEMTSSMPITIFPSISSTKLTSSTPTTILPNILSTELIISMPTTILPNVSSTLFENLSTSQLFSTTPNSTLSTTIPEQMISSTSSKTTGTQISTQNSLLTQSPTITTLKFPSTTDNPLICLDSAVECEGYFPLCNHTTLGYIVKTNCPLTCGSCTIPSNIICYDRFKLCSFSKFLGYCSSPLYTQEHKIKYCKETCGLC